MKKNLFILLFACMFHTYALPIARIDSLLARLKQASSDSEKVKYLIDISFQYNKNGSPNDALENAEEALALATRHNYYNFEALSYFNEAHCYDAKGNSEKELECYLKGLDICEKHNFKELRAKVYDELCIFYRTVMKNNKKALEYSLKELDVARQFGLKKETALAYSNTGSIYYDMNDFTRALNYYKSALSIVDSLNDRDNAATLTNNIGSTYLELKIYDTAIAYYQKSLGSYREIKDKDGEAFALANIGNINTIKGNPEDGVKYSLQALQIARQINDKDLIAGVYGFLSEGYGKMGDYEKAYQYQTYLSNLKDTLYNEENTKQVNDMQVKYDTEKKDKENKILALNINRQRLINYSVTVGLILVTILGFLIYRGYVTKKKANEVLAEKNTIIEEKNKDILDSIHYAKTIQNAILTPEEYLKEELKNYFILYKPRDVVSGDFYWCHVHENKVVFAVADCTGHGVPGAFMSMIGNSLLNEVVIENKITDAAQILNSLRTNLLKTLQQKGQNNITRDGMDIALCVWDKTANTLQFAGANNPLYLVRRGMNGTVKHNEQVNVYGECLAEFLPDKQPIGYYESKTDEPFRAQTVQLQKNDIIYISTDGYTDQFGGEKSKKFTKKQLRDLLPSLNGKGLEEQRDILDKTIEEWKGSTAQTDDICLMGIKFS